MYLTIFTNETGIYHSKEYKSKTASIRYVLTHWHKGITAKVIEGKTTPLQNGLNSTIYTNGNVIFEKSK